MYRMIARIVAQKRILLPVLFAVAVCFLVVQRPERSKAAGNADTVNGPKVIVLNYHKVDYIKRGASLDLLDVSRNWKHWKENTSVTVDLLSYTADGVWVRPH